MIVFSSSGTKLWEKDLGGWIYGVAWSPDGTKIAVGLGLYDNGSDQGRVIVFSSSGTKLWEKDLGTWVLDVVFSPQGDKIAVGTISGVIVFSSSGTKLWEKDLGGRVYSVAWSPQGDKIAVGGDFKRVIVFSLVGKKLWESSNLGDDCVCGVAWSPDGTKIVAGVSNGYLVILYSSDGRMLWESGDLGGWVDRVAWSPDGTKIAVGLGLYDNGSDQGRVIVFSSSGTKLWEKDLGGRVYSVAWSPQGDKIVAGIGWHSDGNFHGRVVVFSGFSGLITPTASTSVVVTSQEAVAGTSTENVSLGGTGVSQEIATTSTHSGMTATGASVPSAFVLPGNFSLVLGVVVVGGVGFVVAVFFVRHGRGRREGVVSVPAVRKSVPNESGVVAGGSSVESADMRGASGGGRVERVGSEVSLDLARDFLGSGFSGLVSGYGCVESYSPRVVEFAGWLVPSGFEGSWECCLLGSGGWGSAYLCRRKGGSVSSVPSEAVFKVPRGFEGLIEGGYVPTVSERLLRRVIAEAEVLGGLKHPNILRLYGASERVPVLVYEFGDGGSVEWQLIHGWEPSLRDVLLLGVQVGDALRYIHSRGLVHGDVKPGNMFFVGGVAKVGDFSTLTKLISRTSTHSRFGYTPGFRAPEQAYSDLRRKAIELGLESRMDVYMLGNLILHVLTGDSIDGEDAVRPGVVDGAVKGVENPELRALLRRMLDPEPTKRPSSEEVVVELLKLLKETG